MEEQKINYKETEMNHFHNKTENVLNTLFDKNKERLNTHNFLVYIGKYEISYESFINNVFWISILEGFLWIILLALFISSPSKLAMMWFFILHFIRAIIGFVILKYIPYSFNIIENMKDFEESSLQEIQTKMIVNFRLNLINNEPKLKPLLSAYFILTIFNILIDISLFFAVLQIWGLDGYGFTTVIVQVSICIFFSIFL
jgi:hypothetical protein